MKARQLIAFVLFFVSGACGLIYETLWCKQLGLIFGNTVHSLSAVLTAFMGGLALGSYMAGRYSCRIKRPLMVYGLLELIIGVYCMMLPFAFGDSSPLIAIYRQLYSDDGSALLSIARFSISFVLMLVPTTMMGATLPVLSEYIVRSPETMGRLAGRLYATNTLGAVIGSAASGFLLIPTFGKSTTNWIAVLGNIVLGLIAFGIGRDEAEGTTPPATQDNITTNLPEKRTRNIPERLLWLTVLTFGLTGFAAMALQIGWTRALSLAMGSSTYAFSLILTVFIFGLSLGGFWGARAAARSADPVALLGRVLLYIGLSCFIVAILLGVGPVIFFFVLAWSSEQSWGMLQICEAAGIGLLILVPTFLMGATTPLTLEVASSSKDNTGKIVGTVYAINTIGAILGSFFGGLVLLPLLHIQSTLELMSLMYAVPGAALFFLSESRSRRAAMWGTLSGIGLLTITAVLAPRWDPLTMCSGTYLMRDRHKVEAARKLQLMEALPQLSNNKILYYNEGVTASVAVVQTGDDIGLIVGGKPDASNFGDMPTQITLMMVPALLNTQDHQDILVIGLGSGVTAGSALALEGVNTVDVVETSPEVVEASYFFKQYNGLQYRPGPHPWVDTPKIHLCINDARNYLLLSAKKFDVITSEPSNPWISGIASLFTREAFQLELSHLKPGGIICQWVQGYSLDTHDFESVIQTFGSVFSHIQVCPVNTGDYLLIGSDSKIQLSPARLKTLLAHPAINDLMSRIQTDSPQNFAALFSADDKELREMSRNSRIITDDNMSLEYSAPKTMHSSHVLLPESRFVSQPDSVLNLAGLTHDQQSEFLRGLDLAASAREHYAFIKDGLGSPRAHEDAILRLAPDQRAAISIIAKRLEEDARGLLDGKSSAGKPDIDGAIELLKTKPPSTHIRWPVKVLEKTLLERASDKIDQGKGNEALQDLQQITNPEFNYQKTYLQGQAMGQVGQFDKAIALILDASTMPQANTFECANMLARIHYAAGRPDEALRAANTMLALPEAGKDRRAAMLYELRAIILAEQNFIAKALSDVQSALKLEPANAKFWRSQSQLQSQMGNLPGAVESMRMCCANLPANESALEQLTIMLLKASEIAGQDTGTILGYLHRARRASRELITLFPNSKTGCELMTRSLLGLAKFDVENAVYYRAETRTQYQKLIEQQQKNGSKEPADLATEVSKLPAADK